MVTWLLPLKVAGPGSPNLPPSKSFPFQVVTGPSRLQWFLDVDAVLFPISLVTESRESRSYGELSKVAEDLSSVHPHSRTFLKPPWLLHIPPRIFLCALPQVFLEIIPLSVQEHLTVCTWAQFPRHPLSPILEALAGSLQLEERPARDFPCLKHTRAPESSSALPRTGEKH